LAVSASSPSGDAPGVGGLGNAGEQLQRPLAVAPLGQQLGQGHDRTFVVGLLGQRLAEGVLVARGYEPVGLGLGRRQAGDELGHALFGEGADEPVDDLAVAQGIDGRDRLHLEGGRDPRVLVDVDLDQLNPALGGVDHLLDDGAQCAARTAPRRPEIDHDGDLLGALEYVLLEGGVSYITHVSKENGCRPARIPTRKLG